jgi:hypothetical protein
MYEVLFGEAPLSESSPDAFHPSSAEVGLAVATPGGGTARLSVLAHRGVDEDLASAVLTEKLSELALVPIRVFPLAGSSMGGAHSQTVGEAGAIVLSYTPDWASEMPHPPPRVGRSIEVELVAPLDAASGVCALGPRVRGAIVVDGLRTSGSLLASDEALRFRPDSVPIPSAGPRCRFLGVFLGVESAHWMLSAQAVGTVTGGDSRGTATWVVAGQRVGVRFEIDGHAAIGVPPVGTSATLPSDETATIESETLSVDSVQIEAVRDDATVLLRRPE